jgi:hypothetical protein
MVEFWTANDTEQRPRRLHAGRSVSSTALARNLENVLNVHRGNTMVRDCRPWSAESCGIGKPFSVAR